MCVCVLAELPGAAISDRQAAAAARHQDRGGDQVPRALPPQGASALKAIEYHTILWINLEWGGMMPSLET